MIREHGDFGLEYYDGEIRVHVPVVINPQVEFLLNGDRLTLAPGEAWYLNVNDWVRSLFRETAHEL